MHVKFWYQCFLGNFRCQLIFFFTAACIKHEGLIRHLNKISRFPHDHLCLSLSWRSACFAATAGGLALARCYATIDESQCVSIRNTFHCHMISHQKQWHGVVVCNGTPTQLYLVIMNCHNSLCLPLKITSMVILTSTFCSYASVSFCVTETLSNLHSKELEHQKQQNWVGLKHE